MWCLLLPLVYCDCCGKEFKKKKSEIERHNNNFCSKACHNEFMVVKIVVFCEVCGKEFKKHRSAIKRSDHNYCSRTCYHKHMVGSGNPFYGKRHSPKTIKNMSGRERTEGHKNNISKAKKGKKIHPPTMETRRKLSESQKGRVFTEEHKRNLIEGAKNRPPVSEETRRKYAGPNHHSWRGGISFEPYGTKFNNKLKRAIRERDGHICQYCRSPGKHVHHIDYDKNNNHPSNFITLCHSCHSKTNIHREIWETLFYSIVGGVPPFARVREVAV